jgi:hypothetical protein
MKLIFHSLYVAIVSTLTMDDASRVEEGRLPPIQVRDVLLMKIRVNNKSEIRLFLIREYDFRQPGSEISLDSGRG